MIPEKTAADYHADLAGRSHTFEDQTVLKIIQVKQRDSGLWITFEISYSNALPRRIVDKLDTFLEKYQHLFSKS